MDPAPNLRIQIINEAVAGTIVTIVAEVVVVFVVAAENQVGNPKSRKMTKNQEVASTKSDRKADLAAKVITEGDLEAGVDIVADQVERLVIEQANTNTEMIVKARKIE